MDNSAETLEGVIKPLGMGIDYALTAGSLVPILITVLSAILSLILVIVFHKFFIRVLLLCLGVFGIIKGAGAIKAMGAGKVGAFLGGLWSQTRFNVNLSSNPHNKRRR